MEERIVAFVYGGYFSPVDEAQIVIVSEFFDVISEAIDLGSEKLGLINSKIVDGKLCLKKGDGGYFVIDASPESPTLIRTDDNLVKVDGNFALPEAHIIEITQNLKERISKAA